MKRVMFAGVMMAAATTFGAMKVATVDVGLLVRNHPNYESNKKVLIGTERDYQKELDAAKAELDAMVEEGRKLATDMQNPMLSEEVKQKKTKDIEELQRKAMRKQQQLRGDAMQSQKRLADLEAKLLKSQADDIKARIAKFAEKEGYDLVLESAAAVYSSADLDVTDVILKDMGVDPKKARAKVDDEGK